jgi:DNA-binding NtrC family response regulator
MKFVTQGDLALSIKILIIDDDESFCDVMKFHLEEVGFEIDAAHDGKTGLSLFTSKKHSIVLTDMKMPGMDGLSLMKEVHKRSPGTPVIVITAFGDIDTAVEAMKCGAFDFVPKPTSREHLKIIVKRAVDHVGLKTKIRELETQKSIKSGDIIFQSSTMEKAIDLADRVAGSDASILITGESGTGKEIIARRIFMKSQRANGPFVTVNCAAIPKNLLESELFGHVKGAFTGATRDRKGKFAAAHKGTILLDEIGELPLELQPRLLRVLQEHTIDVVGSDKTYEVDVRVIASTNINLIEAVKRGEFREDLYFRLNVVQIEMPTLRNRKSDIVLLANHFIQKYSKDRVYRLTNELLQKMEAYDWPGNVRELENTCQRMVLLSTSEMLSADLLPDFAVTQSITPRSFDGTIHLSIPPDGISLDALEKTVIIEALKKNNYNQSKTARFLKISRHILLYRLEKFNIDRNKETDP